MVSSSIPISMLLLIFISSFQAQTVSAEQPLPKSIRVSTLQHSPYLIKSGRSYKGFLVDIMAELSQRINLKYNIISETDTFGHLVDDQWTGVIKDVVTGKADMGLAGLQLTDNRLDAVEYSVPIMHNGIVAMRRRELPSLVKRSVLFCLQPFGAGVWVTIFLMLILTTVLFTINAARNPRERAQRIARGELSQEASVPAEEPLTIREHACHAAWYVLSTAALQSSQRQPMSVTGRILSLSWWIFAGLSLCAYLGALLMTLVTAKGFPAPSFTTVSELAIQARTVGYRVFFVPPRLGEIFKTHQDSSFRRLYAVSLESENYMKDDATRGSRDTAAWARTLLQKSDKNVVVIGSETARSLFNYLECGKIVATEFVDDRYMSLVFPRNATALRVEVNKVLLTLLQEGRMHQLWNNWQLQGSGRCNKGFALSDASWIYREADTKESIIAASQALATMFHNAVPIRFGTFSGVLLLFLFGLFISGGALAADLFIYSRIERHKRGNQVLTNRGGQHRISDTPDFENFNEL